MVLRPALRRAAALAAAVLVLGGCGLIPSGGSSSGASDAGAASSASDGASDAARGDNLPAIGTSHAMGVTGDPATDKAYAAYYGQKLQWHACETHKGAECATLTVPRIWDQPGKGDAHIAMIRLKASGKSTGSLVMNPGGPGASGVSFVGESATSIVSEGVRARYDLIGFDPRGVGESDPIQCLDDASTDEYLAATYDPTTPEGLEEARTWAQRVSDSCAEHSRDMLGVIDTQSAARDLDVMRAALGSEKLDYLGFSYGTYLGSTYADLYPTRAGRMVFDGALDPTLTGDQIADGQAQGFEVAVEHFASWCLEQGSKSCPLTGDADQAVQQIRDFLAATSQHPLATKDPNRPLTGSLARSGILVGLYSDENWTYVAQGLKLAMSGDGSVLLALADLAAERDAEGHYTGNGNFSIMAINCLDHPAVQDESWMAEAARRLTSESPTFGPSLAYSGLGCALWPAGPVRKPAAVHAKGSGPIVVVGTRFDPATPYPWAQSLAKQLDNGHLITWEGEGHTAYGRSGGCVEAAVDSFLLDGTVPADGLVCQ